MLEVRNLTKVYSGKGGVTVKALDDVSVVFPEKGMVFLLGKSGSGKSTLLNVTGGLDKPDGGEIIVKGKSSKEFSGSDFDSYRNTFIGFVFQEYNILSEFTIEQNIALALQLQSKPNDKAAVAALLEQVDLAGYAKRKPNTLSGGQKQRVAIARALIKSPEIIMADEPTGALDSNTGKQVLDTLKKLSETKLVIVVSHDREFAEQYGDRIIELKDGKIISDVSKVYYAPQAMAGENVPGEELPNVSMISEDTIAIRKGEDLTDEEVRKIGEMLRKKGGEAIITADERDLPGVKRVCKINEEGNKESFKPTEGVEAKTYDGTKTRFIKSRLPLGHAVKMGAGGLKSKPIRLLFTILLAVAAFVLFGVVSTFMLYDPDYSVSEALKKADYPSIRLNKYQTGVRKGYEVNTATGEKKLENTDDWEEEVLFGASEVTQKNKNGLSFAGVYYLSDSSDGFEIALETTSSPLYVQVRNELAEYYAVTEVSGYCDCGAAYLESVGFRILAGRYPETDGEVMLPEYLAQLFVCTEGSGISTPAEMVGKKVRLSGQAVQNASFTVVGVVNTGELSSEFNKLRENPQAIGKEEGEILHSKLSDYVGKGFFTLIFVDESFYERFKNNIPYTRYVNVYAQEYEKFRIETTPTDSPLEEGTRSFYTEKTMEDYASVLRYYDLSGNRIETPTLKEGEVFISMSLYNERVRSYVDGYCSRMDGRILFDPEARAELGQWEDETDYRRWCRTSYEKSAQEGLVTCLQKWYVKLAYKEWLYQAANYMMSSGTYYDKNTGNYLNDYQEDGAFSSAYYKIQGYYNENAVTIPTESDWTTIESVVMRDLKNKFERYYYSTIINSFYNDYLVFDEEIIGTMLNYDTLGDEEFAAVKAKIDAVLAGMGMSAEFTVQNVKNFFRFDVGKAVTTVYYNGVGTPASGTLKVAGCFYYGTDYPNASYLLPASFLAKNARKAAGYTTYVERYESKYVAPADAKYNAIISPTDNSRTQIAAALKKGEHTAYHIDNKVVEQLDSFLEMIRELEDIFLYVGLGVGVLAAFFLLNFISVSIAAKRKDIGILRAVGARGSDVFKIFYAEAFIIALICFVLASVGSYVLCFFLNRTIAEALKVSLLHFGAINVALIFGISIFVSVIATFFPVFFAARKSPVDSIRAL